MTHHPYEGYITVRCQFCERLFKIPRPLFTSERSFATCPACSSEAERNTEEMRHAAKLAKVGAAS